MPTRYFKWETVSGDSGGRSTYPTDVSDEEWYFAAPYLTLMNKDAPQRRYELREMFNALRWIVRAGAPWRLLPNDFPPWKLVYQQTQRWIQAGCFEAICPARSCTTQHTSRGVDALGSPFRSWTARVGCDTLRRAFQRTHAGKGKRSITVRRFPQVFVGSRSRNCSNRQRIYVSYFP